LAINSQKLIKTCLQLSELPSIIAATGTHTNL